MNIKDYATGIVATAPSPVLSGTSLVLTTGQGARMPAIPFSATVHPPFSMPDLDTAEKVLVTDVTEDTLTIVRAQGETTAKPIDATWRLTNALFSADLHEPLTVTGEDYITASGQDLTLNPINLDNLSATGTPSVNTYLRGDNSWSEISVGSTSYAANVYMTNTNSDVSGYKVSSYIHDAGETIVSKTVNNNELLIYSYLFDGPIETDTIDSGTWKASLYSAIDAAAGDSYFKFEVYLRHIDNTETVLFSTYSQTIENRTGYEGYIRNEISSVQPNFTVVETDRLGHRIYAKTTAAGDRTLYYVVGDGNASYINTPLSIRHTQLRGLNDDVNVQHITTTQVTKLDSVESGATNNTKATGAELDTATDDVKFATAKALKDSHNVPSVAPSTDGKVMTSNGTDWVSEELPTLATMTTDELLTGTVNGSNTVFTTSANFSTIQVYKNGVAMHLGDDFTITGTNQITCVTAPATGTKLTATYIANSTAMIQGSNSLINDEIPSGTVDGSNGNFYTAYPYIPGTLEVYENGLKQSKNNGSHYYETNPSTGQFICADSVPLGTILTVNYQFVQSVSGNADTLDGFHADSFYPVGTIYTNKTNSANPSTYLPGQSGTTWVAITNRFIVAKGSGTFDTAGATGGEETHILTTPEIPSHTHSAKVAGSAAVGGTASSLVASGSSFYTISDSITGISIDATGGGGAHNNLPPYVVAYVWERVA